MAAGQHGMPRAPRLFPVRRHRKPGRQIVHILENVINRNLFLEAGGHNRAEIFFNIPSDHAHYPVKPGTDGIIHRILDHNGAIRAHGLDLLQPTISTPDSRRQYHQCPAHDVTPILSKNVIHYTMIPRRLTSRY